MYECDSEPQQSRIEEVAPDAGRPGERLLLALETPDGETQLISATATWQLKSDEGYFIGCSYTNEDTYANLRKSFPVAERTSAEPLELTATPSLRLGRLSWIALAAIVGWASWQWLLP